MDGVKLAVSLIDMQINGRKNNQLMFINDINNMRELVIGFNFITLVIEC